MKKYGEPWKLGSEIVEYSPKQCSSFNDQGGTIIDCTGRTVIVGGAQDEQGGAVGVLKKSSAIRILACVNALADIENPEAVKKLIEATRALQEVSSRPNSEVEYYMAKTRLYLALAKLDGKEPSCPPKP